MGVYLEDNPPVRSQFRKPRRDALSGVIVVHTAENAPDYVAFDGGAEAVARFIQGRSDPGSYHDLVDSDSAVGLVDYDAEAFHDGTGTNPHSLGLSVATRADVWPLAPQGWREGAVEQAAQRAARMARHVKARTGIVVPPRRITAVQARTKVPGFTSHAELDPTRRSDPGDGFPWSIFLARYAALTGDLTIPSEEDDMTPEQAKTLDLVSHAVNNLLDVATRLDLWRFAEQQEGDDFDEQAVIATLLPVLSNAATIAKLSDEDVARIAEASAEEQARRLGG